MRNALLSTAAVRALVTVVSAIAGILASHLIIDEFGVATYAQYGLIVTLAALLPFADLGMSAVLINAAARRETEEGRAQLVETVVSVVRLLSVSALAISGVGVICATFGVWGKILGPGAGPNADAVVSVAMIVFALGVPLGIGQALLIGAQRTALQNFVQIIVPVVTLLGCLSASGLRFPPAGFLGVLPYVGNLVAGCLCLALAWRLSYREIIPNALTKFLKLQRSTVRVFGTALPMVVQLIAVPLAMQSGRVILSHLSTVGELARYNLGYQLFGLILQVVGAAGMSLWPYFAAARESRIVRSPFRLSLLFGGVTLVGGVSLAALSPWVGSVISAGQIELDLTMGLVFAAFVTLQAAKYPLGMYMTDERGLKFQIWPSLGLVGVSVGLSMLLAPRLGATGVLLASLVAVAVCQLLPNLAFVWRDLRRRRA